MSTKKIIAKLCFMVVIALSGCHLYNNFYSSYDKSVDFTKYKTYAWLKSHKPHRQTLYDNDVIENNAKNFIDNNFTKRGYTVDTVKPDVLLELVLKNEKAKKIVQAGNPYNYFNFTYYNYPYNYRYNDNLYYNNRSYNYYSYYDYSIPYSYFPDYSLRTIVYMKGTITINVLDRSANKLVWTGSAEGDIYDPQYLKDEIHPAVDKILKQYPIKPIKNKK